MATTVSRRDFIKYAAGGAAAIVVGSKLDWMLNNQEYTALAATQTLTVEITDAMKQMVTHNTINNAQCYFWVYKFTSPALPAECPGPHIFATKGDTISLTITNKLNEPHAFFVPGVVWSTVVPGSYTGGPIAPLATVTGSFVANQPGAHLYYDNLNEPVNRVMGLHGALVVMPDPAERDGAHRLTPYTALAPAPPVSVHVQEIFDAFGGPGTVVPNPAVIFPGLQWEQGDDATGTDPFRTYIWVIHQASPNLFQQVGSLPAGQEMNPNDFKNAFLHDPFSPTNASRTPQYFTMNGQSGHFGHNSKFICPMVRVGEPVVIHILNAGLWTHSLHIHADHFYITSHNLISSPTLLSNPNPFWVDVYHLKPMNRVDYVFPFMRPPDVPNTMGIGRPHPPMRTAAGAGDAFGLGFPAHATWPPIEELNTFIPNAGTVTGNAGTPVSLRVRLSPVCFPMHDHSEPSQTAEGGNYNCGMISGVEYIGDRNIASQDPNFAATAAIAGANLTVVGGVNGPVVTFPEGDPVGPPVTPVVPITPMFPPTATGVAAPPPPWV
jgi:FtsP/CotA-like multicopper oxidase with cupredoxin domain